MPDTSIGALNQSVPPRTQEEPISSETPSADALVCVDRSSGGAEGASGTGAQALVRRFSASDTQGAGGASGSDDCVPSPKDESSCGLEALGAFSSCGKTALLASETMGMAALFGATACAVSLERLVECLTDEPKASKP